MNTLTDSGSTVYSHTNAYSGEGPDNAVVGQLTLDPWLPPAGTKVLLASSDPSVSVGSEERRRRASVLPRQHGHAGLVHDPSSTGDGADHGDDLRDAADGHGRGAAHDRSCGCHPLAGGRERRDGRARWRRATRRCDGHVPQQQARRSCPRPNRSPSSGRLVGRVRASHRAGRQGHERHTDCVVARELPRRSSWYCTHRRRCSRRRRCVVPPGNTRSASIGRSKDPATRSDLEVPGVRDDGRRSVPVRWRRGFRVHDDSLPVGTLYWARRAVAEHELHARPVVGDSAPSRSRRDSPRHCESSGQPAANVLDPCPSPSSEPTRTTRAEVPRSSPPSTRRHRCCTDRVSRSAAASPIAL